MAEAYQLFEKGDWVALDEFVDHCRDEKLVLTCGEPKLMAVYKGLDISNHVEKTDPDKKWQAWLKKLNEWEEANPKSITLPAVKIEFWTSYAWLARGSGYANTVEKEGWELFNERLDEAKTIYEQYALPLGEKRYPCPGFYEATMTVALGQGWTREDVDEKLLTPIIEIYPDYIDGYRSFSSRLKPQWGGKVGDDYRFYQSLVDRIGGPLGKELYARMMLKMKLYATATYRPDLVNWDEIREGMVESLRRFPESSHQLLDSVRYAFKHEGGQKQLLTQLETFSPPALEKFYNDSLLGRAFKANKIERHANFVHKGYFSPSDVHGNNRARSIAVLPNKDTFFVSFGTAGLHEMSLTGEALSARKFEPRRCNGYLAGSSDGKVLFTSSIYDKNYGSKNTILQVWSTAEEPIRVARVLAFQQGYIWYPVVTPDSKQIIFDHQLETPEGPEKNSSLYVWDWQQQGALPRKFLGDGKPTRHRNLTIDEKSNSLYYSTKVLMRLPLDNLDQEPEAIGAKSFPGPLRIVKFGLPDGKPFCVALVRGRKGKLSLFAMHLQTGEILGKRVLKEVGTDAYFFQLTRSEETGQDLVVTTSQSGALSSWSYQFADGKVVFAHESTLPTNGDPSISLKAFKTKTGKDYLIQGLEHGNVGIFAVK